MPRVSRRAAGIAQLDLNVVIDPSSGYETHEISANFARCLSAHKLSEVRGVRADVAQAARRACQHR